MSMINPIAMTMRATTPQPAAAFPAVSRPLVLRGAGGRRDGSVGGASWLLTSGAANADPLISIPHAPQKLSSPASCPQLLHTAMARVPSLVVRVWVVTKNHAELSARGEGN